MDDDERFAHLVANRWGALVRTAFLLTGELAAAEDLVQTALTKTYAVRSRLRKPEAAEAYVRRAMVTTYTSWWRRDRRVTAVPAVPEGAVRDGGAAPAPTADLETVLSRSVLWPHLARLPRGQRAVVVLRYYEDLSEAQTANLLGCSTGTVKSQASRALAALRAGLGDQLEGVR